MKIRQKLLASYFIITVLALIPSLAGLNSYGKLYSQYISMTQDILVGHQSLLTVKQSALTMIVESRDYLRTGDEINAQYARQSMDALRESLRSHIEHEVHIGEAEQGVAEEIECKGLHLIDLCSNLIAAYQRGVSEEILSQGRTDIRMCKDDLFDTLDEHFAIHEQELLDVQAGNYTAIIRSLWTLLAGCVLIVAAGLASAFCIAKSIINPISELEAGANIIGSGDLTYKLNIETGDEIEQLAAAFNTMADQLNKMMYALEQRITERKQAEEEITRLASVIEQATVTVVITDLDGNITYANPYFETSSGYTAAGALGKNPRILKSGQQDDAFYQTLWDTVTTGKPWEGTFINKRKDGSLYHEYASIFPIQDASRKTINYAAVKRDITEQVQAEDDLRESEERFRAIFETAQDSIFIKDHTRKYTQVNPAMERLFRLPASKLIGQTDEGLFGKETDAHIREEDSRVLSGEIIEGEDTKLAAGMLTTFHVIKVPMRNSLGEIIGLCGIARNITERKRAEAALQESEEKFSKVVDYSYNWEYWVNPHGQFVYVSPACERITGYNADEFLQNPKLAATIVHPDDVNFVKHHKHAVRETGEIEAIEFRIITKDGEERWIGHVCQTIYGRDGVDLGQRGSNRDITQRVQMEKNLQEREQRFRSLFEHINDAVFFISLDLISLAANQQAADMLGYEVDELVGISIEDIIAPREYPDAQQRMDVLLAGQILPIYERIFRKKDGTEFPVEISLALIYDDHGNPQYIQSVVRDITERTRALREMKQRSEELTSLAQVSSAMRTVQSRDEIIAVILGQVIELFQAVGAALGLHNEPQNEILVEQACGVWTNWAGKSLSASLGVCSQVITTGQPYQNSDIQADELFDYEELLGEVRSLVCVPLIAQETVIGAIWLGSQTHIIDRQVRLLTAIADMTATAIHRQSLHQSLEEQVVALQIAQARLVQSEKLAAIGELTAGVAHELNNPLTTILLYAEILQRRTPSREAYSDLKKIVSESLRAADIVRGLLDFARQRPPKRKSIQINDVLSSSLDLIAYELTSRGIKWIPQLSPDVPLTMADPHQLQQVFINLLNNALHSMVAANGGGVLHVFTEVGPSTFHATTTAATPMIRITIQDDGLGIDPDHIIRIFDPFFTTKPEAEGSGLGLSICHGIISKHGGYIWAESESGQGAAFIIELPIIAPPAIAMLMDVDEPPPVETAAMSRVMLIDDEPNILEVVATILRRQGYLVDAVDNGIEALQLLSEFSYALIICDIHMPGISGLKFYRRVQQEYPHLVDMIVFTTGDTVSRSTRHFFDETGVSCLVKPFEMDELIQLVRTEVSKNQSACV